VKLATHLHLLSEKSFLVASLTSIAPRQFLERIVTADETWVHHYEPVSIAQSMAWKHLTSPVAKKFENSTISQLRLCLHFFGDMESAILVPFIPKGETVDRFPYAWLYERSCKRKEIFIR
jgi:hypothetical protein